MLQNCVRDVAKALLTEMVEVVEEETKEKIIWATVTSKDLRGATSLLLKECQRMHWNLKVVFQ